MAKPRVFVDTMIIIEAFRTGCWTGICSHFAVETVEKCVQEALKGNDMIGHVDVPEHELRGALAQCHVVGKKEVATLAIEHPHCQGLDEGELHLLAWFHANQRPADVLVLLSTADKAAIVASKDLGLLDRLRSLEYLSRAAGVSQKQVSSLPRHHTEDFLGEVRTKVVLGVIP